MERRFIALRGNSQRLDGGAMFGNAPKALWSRWVPADELNRIPLACNVLLVEERGPNGVRRLLFETGIGAFFEPTLAARYGVVEREHCLLKGLAEIGLSDGDIDLVMLSHLHFDHAGGLLAAWEEGVAPRLLFPNALYLTGRDQWQRARAPHLRDRASYVPELVELLEASGRLRLVEGEQAPELGAGYHFIRSDGHSPGMLLTEIETGQGPLVYGADLVPATPWVNLPITMGYDRAAEQLIDEKTQLLESLQQRRGWLFFSHDPDCFAARIVRDERGRYQPQEPMAQAGVLSAWPLR
ncbi:MBL fold metallo-hydrolase [Aestuariirhabdus litorea]|uniref:MBL fold metallo-hydrolase n=1 Tax=Aestuariirhabdus litorea TaxID=2528527 RepID=A0A3P3VTS2_9GAMM|nr:MBL fold metallo-hydrolase [Aestuariirhabdus litorea]RRJ85368.1 MBL fold metallo-hydrolase [Aestuariirhabdus litorea]RWW98592.1 MBL fold metallo-hydrolase [Endozoicomonadaceae bacterium GTF-13]